MNRRSPVHRIPPPGAGSSSCFWSSSTRASVRLENPARVGCDARRLGESAPERLGLLDRDVGRRTRDAVDARDERLRAGHAE